MAVCIKCICRAKEQEFIKACIQQRFLFSRAKTNLPSIPSLHLKRMKHLFAQGNSYLELKNGAQYLSTDNFHSLAISIFMDDVAYITDMATRNFTDDKKNISNPPSMSGIQLDNANERLQQELSRLRIKGAMSDIPIKTPEGIVGIDGRKQEGQ